MRKTSIGLVILLLIALSAAGLVAAVCHQWPRQVLVAQTDTPRAAVQSLIRDLRRADFDSLRKHLLPPAAAAAVRDSWGDMDGRARVQATALERAKFAAFMHKLTAPDAEEKLFARAKPVLDDWEHGGKQRLPMMVGVARLLLGASITRAHALDDDQKRQLHDLLDVLATWAGNTDWGDEKNARTAIGIAVSTARALDIKTLDDAYALTYEQAMPRYATLWNGLRRVLNVYGLSVEAVLDSATVKTIGHDGDKASVTVDYRVLGHAEAVTFGMVRRDGRWYGAQVLAWWQAHHENAAQAPAAPATAGSPLPAASGSAP